jgi:hypothetical protein
MMRIARINYPDLLYVADNMRDMDKNEIFATRWDENPESLVDSIMKYGDFGWVVGSEDGIPIAAFGAIPIWPGSWQVWMFATDRWNEVSTQVTKFIKRVMIPAIVDAGWNRAECKSIEDHPTAHRWLEMLGATHEHTLACFGKDGQAFRLYSWTKDTFKPN